MGRRQAGHADPARILWLLLAAAALLASPSGAVRVGDPAPDFRLADLSGRSHSLSGYSAHPVLLMFLECDATVSIAVAPLVETDFHRRYSSQGLAVLGVECSGCSRSGLDDFRNQTGVGFPLLLEGVSTQAAYAVPLGSFVLIDGSGIVRYVAEGPGIEGYDASSMRGAVEMILREANNTKTATWGQIRSLYN